MKCKYLNIVEDKNEYIIVTYNNCKYYNKKGINCLGIKNIKKKRKVVKCKECRKRIFFRFCN